MDNPLPNSAMLVDRVTRLEEIYSHQQHLVDQLNEVIIGLRVEMAALKKKYEEQQTKLKSLTADHSIIEFDPDERPPHY